MAIASIRSRLGRSALTSLGIVISVASIIAVVSIIQGLSYSVLSSFEGMGTNVLTVQSKTPFEDALRGITNRLTMEDYLATKRDFGDAGRIVPFFLPFGPGGARITNMSHSTQTRVLAATASYKDAVRVFPAQGRFVADSDNELGHKVCVIGSDVSKALKLPDNAVGQFIKVNGVNMEVVGVMETRGDIFGVSQDDYVVIPFAIGQRIAPANMRLDVSIIIDVRDFSRINEYAARIADKLRAMHHLKPTEDDDFQVQTSQQLRESVSRITDAITLVLGGVVGISLLVSGVGIMNMMMFTVTERTREIGIAKAIGAPRHLILLQFLLEATILAFVGAVIGVMGGWLIGWLISLAIPVLPAPVVPTWAIALSVSFSTIIGLIFGVAPAARAADLNPIDALRFE